ncbi:MAG: putative entry exclusion protein TrbK-alt [Sphingopyxis terrae]|nr:putative entry exclusion protein TrbK-alt [Sphingopyxis terrae]
MSRTGKIVIAATLGGLFLALSIVVTLRPEPSVETIVVPEDESATDPLDRLDGDLRRCRTLTMPDAGCEAAWEAQRRRFFREGDRP